MFYVYIISNNFRNVLYIGVTRNLERRLYEHKNKLIDGFSKKYNLNVLLFYETTEYALDAIAREKQLKKWNRDKKFDLIKSVNPELRDLSEDWWFLYESFTGLTIICKQIIVMRSLRFIRFTHFGRDDVFGAFLFKVLWRELFCFLCNFKKFLKFIYHLR